MRFDLALLYTALLFVATSCAPDLDAVQGVSSRDAASTQAASAGPTEEQALAPKASSEPPQDGVYASAYEETNIRSGPGTMFEVIGKLMPGQQYEVTGKDHDWLRLRIDGNPAWVFSTLVNLRGDLGSIAELISSPSTGSLTTETFADSDMAISHIRSFLGNADLTLTFVEFSLMINSPHADRQVAVFEDQLGTRYSVDPSTYVLTQIEPSGLHFPSGSSVSLDFIRQTARDLAESSPGFSNLAPTLQYEEAQKNELHFFVWVDTRPGWSFNRPQLQVGILDNGSLFAYMNTLIWAP